MEKIIRKHNDKKFYKILLCQMDIFQLMKILKFLKHFLNSNYLYYNLTLNTFQNNLYYFDYYLFIFC